MIDLGPLTGRVAGAPISWGVCEAPGWGHQLPPSVVLAEMAELGIPATELGPTGYLGDGPERVRTALAGHDMRLIGGYLPVVLHTAAEVDLADANSAIGTLAAAGSDVVVLAADAGPSGYTEKVRLDSTQWGHLLHNLERVRRIALDAGLDTTLHPHVGTAIETGEVVERLLADSDVPLCLDTGHLAAGGADPSRLVQEHADRVGHVHLKDVRMSMAKLVADGALGFAEAVHGGLFTPLGDGDLDIAGVIRTLEDAGYAGWYVLEQDIALDSAPGPGQGPVHDVRRSLDFLAAL